MHAVSLLKHTDSVWQRVQNNNGICLYIDIDYTHAVTLALLGAVPTKSCTFAFVPTILL
jgi:hypothetical protein